MSAGFIDRLIDWKGFELFVRDLYAQDPNLITEHNVMETGKSGARRQIDVKITLKTPLHTLVILAECKYWSVKVDRQVIDVMAAHLEDLGAAKGAIFTKIGFEPGAESYAKSKNIDIFVVRELTNDEWGQPGRRVHFYLHTCAGRANYFELPGAQMMVLVERPPARVDLNIVIGKDEALDEAFRLHSAKDGEKGEHLVSILCAHHTKIVNAVSGKVPLLKNGEDGATMAVVSDVELDFSAYEFRQLRLKYGAVNLGLMKFKFVTHITQSVIDIDRGAKYDVALMVENFITNERKLVSKRTDTSNLEVVEAEAEKSTQGSVSGKDVFANGSILKVTCSPFVNVQLNQREIMAKTGPLKFKL
jgi:hypothetical protein